MRCAACAHDNREGRKFCTACGAALTLACPSCNAPSEPGERFCGDCGAALTTALPPPQPVAPRAPVPPQHLADKIRHARPALEGARKHITVLFVDVKGSMTLAERFDPEQWFRIVEDFFNVAADGVRRFEGTVNQFTGDGMMALFGAPIAHEDHAQRACLAALHMRDAVRAFAEDVFARHGVRFDIRIGLNSGEVIIGRISCAAGWPPLLAIRMHPNKRYAMRLPSTARSAPRDTRNGRRTRSTHQQPKENSHNV